MNSNSLFIVDEQKNDPPDLATLTSLAADFALGVQNNYLQLLTPNETMLSVTATQVRDPKVSPPEALLQAVHVMNNPGIRTVSGGIAPAPVCAVLSFASSVASRRFRGHNFMPPAFSSAAFSGDQWTKGSDPYWIGITVWRTWLLQGLAGASVPWQGSTLPSYNLCLFSRIAELQNVASVALTTGININPRVRWLRSRQRGQT